MKKSFKITVDLADSHLYHLLKFEAIRRHESMKEVICDALKTYFEDHFETQAMAQAAEKEFFEWENPLDSKYDKL